jgi:NTP pyrophosphatase (non-canonical NTP hydrolase)
MVKKNIQNLDDIIDVVKKLRDPKKGCPWDIQQNAKSLAKYTLEEAYEVVEAIESGNYNELEMN